MKSKSFQQFKHQDKALGEFGDQLSQFCQETSKLLAQEGVDTQGLQVISNELAQTLKILNNQQYQVAVIGSIKSGKSTLLNAVIGAEVLANESKACTACWTNVRHLKSGKPRLLEYRNGRSNPVTLVEGNAEKIEKTFLDYTHKARKRNQLDHSTWLELWHPIEAIGKEPSLAGLTLIDTPGFDEWNSTVREKVAQAIKTCDAIWFVLDYTHCEHEGFLNLFQELLKTRPEMIRQHTNKLYFILNKIDQRKSKDEPIEATVRELKETLKGFGFPDPIIYPVSARKGLLARLIIQQAATQENREDFKKEFGPDYLEEDKQGRSFIPLPRKIAPQALKDSNLPKLEKEGFQAVIASSGWHLLSDSLGKLEKALNNVIAQLAQQRQHWQAALDQGEQAVEKARSDWKRAVDAKLRIKQLIEEKHQAFLEQASGLFHECYQEIKSLVQGHNFNGKAYSHDDTFFPVHINFNGKAYDDALSKGREELNRCSSAANRKLNQARVRVVEQEKLFQQELLSEILQITWAVSKPLSAQIQHGQPHSIDIPSFDIPNVDVRVTSYQEPYTEEVQVTKYRTETRTEREESPYQPYVEIVMGMSPRYVYREYVKEVPYTATETRHRKRVVYEIDSEATKEQLLEQIERQASVVSEQLKQAVNHNAQLWSENTNLIESYIESFQGELEIEQEKQRKLQIQVERIYRLINEQEETSQYLQTKIGLMRLDLK